MADPVKFQGFTDFLNAPAGMENCVALPILRIADGQIVSCWKLTPEEIENIQKTGVVWLSVFSGRTQPPVLVSGENYITYDGEPSEPILDN